MRATRGFTLIEAMVAISLLAIILGGSFVFFRMGSRGFFKAVNKSGAVGELQRATRVLQKDVEMTNFVSVGVHNRVTTTSKGDFSRDGLAVAGLSSWADSSNFEAGTELPKWDRWEIFYATTEDSARLYKMEIDRAHPGGNYYPLEPMGNIGKYMSNDPLSVKGSTRITRLCQNVREFSVESDPLTQNVKLKLVLFNRLGKQMTSEKNVEETLETQYEILPLNTYPEL